MAIGQLTRYRKHEPNPYRPDLPEDLRNISPNLYDFLRETAETLREQHNLTQAGDSTFSWEVLTEIDLGARYNVGSLGRFYHPTYGVIHARYCRISGFKSTEWLGAPVGLRTDGDPLKWSVTNDMSKSKPDLVVGLGGWFTLPPEDSYGWVIVNGVNIQGLAIRKRTDLAQFDKFVWGTTDRAQDAKAAEGRVFGSVLGVSSDITEVTETETGGDFFLATTADRTGVEEYQRFEPLFWTCNFPSTMIASLTTSGETLICDATFYKTNDLCGIIWESADVWDHPLTSYDTNKNYSGCVLTFTINISGATLNLADTNGPVLTIEGRNNSGVATTWYVRLINYRTSGNNVNAQIVLNFDNLFGGFAADIPVFPGDIDRMFIGFVPASYSTGAPTQMAQPEVAKIQLSNIAATGVNSFLVAGNGRGVHALRMTNGYDDTYNVTPERLVRNCHRLGYREWFNHYVGMSHYFYWKWDVGENRFIAQDIASPLNGPCVVWHRDLCQRLKAHGYIVIFSISYEMLNSFMPANWRQLDSDGLPALTGWAPPSSLFSPTIAAGMSYLDRVFVKFADILNEVGLPIHMQVGEPWWWIDFRDFKPYFYDATTVAKWEADTGLPTPIMTTMVGSKTEAEIQYLNWLGDRLAESTATKIQAVRDKYPVMTSYVLVYLPQVLSGFAGTPDTPEAKRVNIPLGWAKPAFDVLQLEDYDFVINNEPHLSEQGRLLAEDRLGYPRDEQQYFSGFVLFKEDDQIWEYSSNAVRQAYEFGVPEVFIWAYTQVMRDGYVNLLDPESLYRTWNLPAGFAFVDLQGESEKRIRDWIDQAVDTSIQQIAELQTQVNQLLGSGGLGGLTVRIGAVEKTVQEHTTLISRQSELTTQNFQTFNDRITILEQETTTGGAGGSNAAIRADLNNLSNDFNNYRNSTNGRLDVLTTQMSGALAVTSVVDAELDSIRLELEGIGSRITDTRLWQLADVPDSYVGNGGKFLQVLNDGTGTTFTALTAGIITFTPSGGIASTDVQAAITELDSEKARLDGAAFTGNISVPNDAYGVGWNGSQQVATKDAIYDRIESLVTSIAAKLTGAALTSSAALIPALNSPWINYGSGFGGARYYKSADGVVHIEGLIQAPGGSPTSGIVLFTLLAGYRPPDTLMFGPWSGGGSCRIDVQSSGQVVMQSGNTAFTSLSGISFIPA
jgi:hypothetical protein